MNFNSMKPQIENFNTISLISSKPGLRVVAASFLRFVLANWSFGSIPFFGILLKHLMRLDKPQKDIADDLSRSPKFSIKTNKTLDNLYKLQP